jgi:hypothetical protein
VTRLSPVFVRPTQRPVTERGSSSRCLPTDARHDHVRSAGISMASFWEQIMLSGTPTLMNDCLTGKIGICYREFFTSIPSRN